MTVFDLAQPMRRGMPQSPNHPAYTHALVRRHGDLVRAGGGSAANDILVTGTHVGTHVDALAHVSQDGLLHGRIAAADVQSDAGFARLGIDEFPPFVGRGVLLDVAALHGVQVLPPGYEVTAADLRAAAGDLPVGPGDAVLVGTGWSRRFGEGSSFLGTRDGVPGVGESAARWLAERGVAVTGGETIAYERIAPGAGHTSLPVHRILLVEAGINIVETMLLHELADAGVAEFQFILAPLKLVGATGSPVRPLAVVP
ncbi:cyclase family protein [Actinoplanes sp. NPDC024001]|uniref:cyclase family protein n=1 Tax=Actinoplanes sp. NPDC024001 TaxID=3154598 RepID=UPI0033DD53D0